MLENNLLTKEDIKEIELIVREIAADNMLPGSTDMEVEFTTRDCNPLVSGIRAMDQLTMLPAMPMARR